MKAGKKWRSISTMSIMIIMMIHSTGLVSAQTGAPAPQKAHRVRQEDKHDRHRQGSPGLERGRGRAAAADQTAEPVGRPVEVAAPAIAGHHPTGQCHRAEGAEQRRSGPERPPRKPSNRPPRRKAWPIRLLPTLLEVQTALSRVVSTKTQDEGKQLSALESLVGRFRFSGDVRVRGESYFQTGSSRPQPGPHSCALRSGWPAERRFHRRHCFGYGRSGQPNLDQRDPYQRLRSQDHRPGSWIHHLQSDRPSLAFSHRWKVCLHLAADLRHLRS